MLYTRAAGALSKGPRPKGPRLRASSRAESLSGSRRICAANIGVTEIRGSKSARRRIAELKSARNNSVPPARASVRSAPLKLASVKYRLAQIGPLEPRLSQVRRGQLGLVEVCAFQVRALQVRVGQVRSFQIGSRKVRPGKIGAHAGVVSADKSVVGFQDVGEFLSFVSNVIRGSPSPSFLNVSFSHCFPESSRAS